MTFIAASLLTSCGGSRVSVERPNLAAIDPKLTEPCADPAVLKPVMSPGQQANAWASDRAALVGCKQKHNGLTAVIFTERKLIGGAGE